MPRQGVVRLGRGLVGPSFTNPNFRLKFSRESDLADFVVQRFRVTTSKLMIATAQAYAEQSIGLPLTVGGASFQHGSGRSEVLTIGNKSYLFGIQAAHFGVGTVYRGGEALSKYAERQVQTLRETSGFPDGDPRSQFDANADLASRGLVYDGMTYYAPAFVNQSDGVIERVVQPGLSLYLPVVVPATVEQLELFQTASAVRFYETFPKTLARAIRRRLDDIRKGEATAYTQHSTDLVNLIYQGGEPQYLETLRDKLENPASDLQDKLERSVLFIPEESRENAELAEASREELAATTSSTTTSSTTTEQG